MPIVPTAENRVGIASVSDEKVRAADFSGTGLQAIGAGLQQVGHAGAQFAEQQKRNQDLYDDAAVKKGWNAYSEGSRQILRTGDNAFYNQDGFNAGNALKPTESALTKLRDDARAMLKSDRQRSLFDMAIAERHGVDLSGIHDYANKQLKVEQNRQSDGVKVNSANDALDHADDPVMFGEYVATGVKALQAQAIAQGWAPEMLKAKTVEYVSGIHAAVTDQKMIADPVGAAAYALQHGADMTFADRVKLQKALYDPLMERQGVADIDGYFGSQSGAIPETPKAAPGDPSVAARMVAITAHTESGNRERGAGGKLVTSSAGAQGKMQVMPGTRVDPGFGIRPAQDDSDEERTRVGRDYLSAMVKRYGGDAAKAWAAYNGGPGRVDAAMKAKGEAWLSAMPKETRDYVATNMAALGGNGSATYAPRRDDLNGIYQWIDGQPWDFERKQQARKEADNRVARNDKLLARQEDSAKDAALETVESLGNGFTSISQLPADVRRQLSPEVRLSLINQAEQNAKPKAIAANGDAIINLHQLAETDPEAFKKKDLRLFRTEVSPGEYDQIATLQAKMIANPSSGEKIAHSRIWGQINFLGRDVGVDMGPFREKGQNRETKEQFTARRRDGMQLFTIMQNYLHALTEGKRQPTDDEIKRAFDNAVMPKLGPEGALTPRFRIADLPTNSIAIPRDVQESLRARRKAMGLPYDDASVARMYIQGAR